MSAKKASHREAGRSPASAVSAPRRPDGGDSGGARRRLRALIEAERSDVDHAELLDILHDHDVRRVWDALCALHGELDSASEELGSVEVERRRARLGELGWEVLDSAPTAAVRSYRELLRDISHDIRSPLNSILFLSEGLTSHQSSGLSSTQRRQASIVYAAAASLLNLVNDLLDFSRTSEGDVGGVASIPFSITAVVGDVKRLIAPLADYHETDLRVESALGGARKGDPQLLCRLLINLVSNAIEAADVGGRVEVLLDATESGAMRIKVADDGPGAELDTIRRLLAPQPEERLTRMLHGRTHGLGVIICGRLVRAAGGRIDVQPRDENGGTRFEVELPFLPLVDAE
jgi:signal transduction histidine kinase